MDDASQIAGMLERIEAHLAARGTPQDIQQAIEDVFNTYGQIAQMREVLAQLVAIVHKHDAERALEHEQIQALLVQLRELARKQVAGLADVQRAVEANSEVWSGEERRTSIADRRRAS